MKKTKAPKTDAAILVQKVDKAISLLKMTHDRLTDIDGDSFCLMGIEQARKEITEISLFLNAQLHSEKTALYLEQFKVVRNGE